MASDEHGKITGVSLTNLTLSRQKKKVLQGKRRDKNEAFSEKSIFKDSQTGYVTVPSRLENSQS